MKKLVILLILLTSCSISKEQEKYENYIKKSKESNNIIETQHLNLELSIEKLLDEYMYTLVIDNPKEDIKNIEVLINHNKKTRDIFPSSGIFEKQLNMKPNYVNHKKNYVKGIILVGYLSNIKDSKFNLYLKYNIDSEEFVLKGRIKHKE